MTRASQISWTSSSRTDVGRVRQVNEDACLERPERGLFAVADGMGGHAAGDVASSMVVDALAAIEPSDALSELVERVEDELIRANDELREIASSHHNQTIGTTVAVLCLRGEHGICVWAGDSRVYRARAERLEMVSQDHALVEELVERGVLSREDAAYHPQGNLVTRAVGAMDSLAVDMEIVELRAGDRFVLCSDGLDKEVSGEEIAALSCSVPVHELADRLVDLALERGARDNVTVVAVEVADADAPRRPADEAPNGSEETIPNSTPASRTLHGDEL